jgi:hypothetical protein
MAAKQNSLSGRFAEIMPPPLIRKDKKKKKKERKRRTNSAVCVCEEQGEKILQNEKW